MGMGVVSAATQHGVWRRGSRQLTPSAVLHTRELCSRGPVAPRRRLCRPAPPAKASPSAATAAATAEAPSIPQLPDSLRNNTAVLKDSKSGATVYVLGISHCSKESCRQIEQLIAHVRPDTVLLELCKERTGLLFDPSAPPPSAWHTARIRLSGLPTGSGWPSQQQLVENLQCRGSSPVSAVAIEDDALALLSTGLFSSSKPAAKPPAASDAPAFVVQDGGRLQPAAPLGELEFVVKPRSLPPVQQLEVQAEGGLALPPGAAERAQQACAAAPGGAALSGYLQARCILLEALPAGAREGSEVVFSGVDTGRATAVLRPVPTGQARSLTGLEGSAPGGVGWGIEPFQRQARPAATAPRAGVLTVQLGSGGAARGGSSSGQGAAAALSEQEAAAQLTQLRPWTDAELQSGAAGSSAGPRGNPLADVLTGVYGQLQAKAGRTVGIAPGAAWRVALKAAVAAGARRVLLGDLPAATTAAGLADGILQKCGLFLFASVPAAAASGVIAAQGFEPGAANPAVVVAAALLPLAAVAAPVLGPLVEVARFANGSAAEIEEAVRVREPLQAADPAAPPLKLWGEDALLGWPGAMDPVIHARDAYMAAALAAAVSHAAGGRTPAFVVTQAAGGRRVVQYAQPEGGPAGACPTGSGAGAYAPPPPPQRLVAVVGTAHVRGIVKAWPSAQQDPSLGPLL